MSELSIDAGTHASSARSSRSPTAPCRDLRRPHGRPALGRLCAPCRLRRSGAIGDLRRRARGGVPALRLLGRARRRPLLDHHADALQDDRAVGKPGRLAPPVGLRSLARLLGSPVRHAPQAPRGGAVGDRCPVRPRRLLHRPDGHLGRRRDAVHADEPRAGRRPWPQPAPSPSRRWRSIRRCSIRATSCSRSRSRSRSGP